MGLVVDWKQAHKWLSVQVATFGFVGSAVGAALAATGAVVPWFSVLKAWEVFAMASVVFLGVLVGRLWKQKLNGGDHGDA